jgi:hypothetical protein
MMQTGKKIIPAARSETGIYLRLGLQWLPEGSRKRLPLCVMKDDSDIGRIAAQACRICWR